MFSENDMIYWLLYIKLQKQEKNFKVNFIVYIQNFEIPEAKQFKNQFPRAFIGQFEPVLNQNILGDLGTSAGNLEQKPWDSKLGTANLGQQTWDSKLKEVNLGPKTWDSKLKIATLGQQTGDNKLRMKQEQQKNAKFCLAFLETY